MIETERLVLRRWRDEDRAPYAEMMADPEVAYWLGATLSATEANRHIDRALAELADTGMGFLAIERRADRAFVGAACLRAVYEDHPLAGEVEIGWRLARGAWGEGYASEAARGLIDDGFERTGLTEIVAFTAETNARSEAVMRRLGMRRETMRDFDHPALAAGHPLRRHIVYAISKD